MTQWYTIQPHGPRRLELEKRLMNRYTRFQLYVDDSTGDMMWRGRLTSHGHVHRDIRLEYSRIHPRNKMDVYVLQPQLPQSNSHIHYDGSICYEMGNWEPSWTALQVACLTQHFLNELYSGKMSSSPPISPHPENLLPLNEMLRRIRENFA